MIFEWIKPSHSFCLKPPFQNIELVLFRNPCAKIANIGLVEGVKSSKMHSFGGCSSTKILVKFGAYSSTDIVVKLRGCSLTDFVVNFGGLSSIKGPVKLEDVLKQYCSQIYYIAFTILLQKKNPGHFNILLYSPGKTL